MHKKNNVIKVLWYSVENLTTLAFGLISVVVVARLFGPESLGKLSYIQSISAITIFITTLGLDHIIVRDLARKPGDMKYISTVFISQLVMCVVQSVVLYLCLYWTRDGDVSSDIFTIFILISISVYFSRATVVKFHFQSINKPKIIGTSALISRLFALAYLAVAIHFDFRYEYVVAFIPIQSAIQFFIMFVRFQSENTLKLNFDIVLIKNLLKESLPLLASAALYPIFMQADVILIAFYLGDADVGIYSAASKIVMQFTFIGIIITMTFYVPLSKKVDNDSEDKFYYLSGMIKILATISFMIIVSVQLTSTMVIEFLFGNEFYESAHILNILVFKTLFVFIAAIISRVLILMHLAKYELIKSLLAATFSLSINIALIPTFGIQGVAIVSVLSYLLADLLIYAFFKDTQSIFLITIKAITEIFYMPIKSVKNINYVFVSKS